MKLIFNNWRSFSPGSVGSLGLRWVEVYLVWKFNFISIIENLSSPGVWEILVLGIVSVGSLSRSDSSSFVASFQIVTSSLWVALKSIAIYGQSSPPGKETSGMGMRRFSVSRGAIGRGGVVRRGPPSVVRTGDYSNFLECFSHFILKCR